MTETKAIQDIEEQHPSDEKDVLPLDPNSLLPGSIAEQIRKEGFEFNFEMPKDAEEYLEAFVSSTVVQSKNKMGEIKKNIQHAVQHLDPTRRYLRVSKRKRGGGSSMLHSTRRKRFTHDEQYKFGMKLFQKKQFIFEELKPLHRLWKQYALSIINPDYVTLSNARTAAQHVTRLELVGCFLWVRGSSCSALIGLAGIVVKETMHLLQIVTKDDAVKTLQKEVVELQFELKGCLFTLFGSEMIMRPADRATKKYHVNFKNCMYRADREIPKETQE